MRQVADALAEARLGDQTAFADLVRHHQGMVFSLAYNFLRDRALAEELAQEVFLHLFRRLAQIDSPEHLVFWLRKVTGHRCIDYLRRHKHDPRLSVDDLPERAAEIRESDPLLSEMLQRFVATLPERPRMILALRYQEDLDPAEIAEVLSMPVNTVKSHLRRSLSMLREKVARCLGEVEV